MEIYLVIGEITSPQGVRGEVKLRPITCDAGRFDGLTPAFLSAARHMCPCVSRVNRARPDAVFLSVEGVTDRNAAEKLRGELPICGSCPRGAIGCGYQFPLRPDRPARSGRFAGGDLGQLVSVLQPGGNDVYVFHGPMGEVLVPAIKSVVCKVDLEKGEMLLDSKRLQEVAVFDED